MESLESVRRVLIHRRRADLADLLRRAAVNFDESDTYGSYLFSRLTTAEVYAPIEDCDQLRALSEEDTNSILQALLEIHPPKAYDMEITGIAYYVDTDSLGNELMVDDRLIQEIETERNLMITVATGGPRIAEVNPEYTARRTTIRDALQSRGLTDPNPYSDLWAWHGKWSSGDLPTYRSRREYISALYEPLLERIRRGPSSHGTGIFEEPTGWTRVDRGLGEVRVRLVEAATEEQYQAVGLLCREVLISLAQTAYDPTRHTTTDGVTPSETDAKRRLDAYLIHELAGSANEIARKHARASLELANELQHRRTAAFRQAALCAEATTSVVNLIAIISGQRDP